MNADTMLDILTLQEAVKVLKRKASGPHTEMMAHSGYAEHSHEVRADHAGVQAQFPPETDPNENAIRWLTEIIKWIKEEEKT
jgi:hypothetical protein